ncbi:MAG: hypothetical protein ER33_13665 [Cyanobium sp. CACIAM 14]|nr:MAG: hypothetical protein ER33_13665 [Cyanobium sp. CACIAM 14]
MAAEGGDTAIPELIQLGERLGRARKEQGLSLEELADRLRIGTEQLMALEAGDHTHLPETVFVVAQAKRVAGALGIDVTQQISDLLASPRVRSVRRPAAAPARRQPPGGSARQPGKGSGAGLAGAFGWVLLALGGGALTVAALLGKLPAVPAWRTASPTPPSPRMTPAPPSPAVAPTQVGPDQLLLKSHGLSWLEVRTATGDTLFRGTFSGEKRFPLGQGLRVLAGRPDLVTASRSRQEARPLGRIDQVVWRTFRPDPAAR